MKINLLLTLISACLISCMDQEVFDTENIIPTPKELEVKDNRLYKIESVSVAEEANNLMYLQNTGEYYLKSVKGQVVIEGNEIWARQTLAQLTDEKGRIPDVEIHDWPVYPMGGFMHDTGRNFQSIEL